MSRSPTLPQPDQQHVYAALSPAAIAHGHLSSIPLIIKYILWTTELVTVAHSARRTQMEQSLLAQATRFPPSQINPHGYALRIKEYAERPVNLDIRTGVHFRALAVFLNRPYSEQYPTARSEIFVNSTRPLVYVHSSAENSRSTIKRYRLVGDYNDFFDNAPSLTSDAAHVIWLAGYPAPEWVNAIGAKHRIDPEFFRRHLAFMRPKEYSPLTAMPSSTERMLTIRLTTICTRPSALSRLDIERARAEEVKCVRQHQQKLRIGESIVRNYTVLDNTTFAVEQDVSIYVGRGKQHNGWIAVICSDLGENLIKGSPAPWNTDKSGVAIKCDPVMMHVPKMALEKPPRPTSQAYEMDDMHQNARSHPETFAMPPTSDALRIDIRDALYEVFALAATAEYQYLATMQDLIDRELQVQAQRQTQPLLHLPSSSRRIERTSSDLQHFKSSLDHHITKLEDMVGFLRRNELRNWAPHPEATRSSVYSQAAVNDHLRVQSAPTRETILEARQTGRLENLRDDFAYLLQHATKLSQRCVEGTTVLMNMAMLEESKKAIIQADGLRRLTLLTFFFLPLSLTTSFFGMNFTELGTGNRSVWLFFAGAIPFLLLSLILCFWSEIRSKFLEKFYTAKQVKYP